MKKSVKTTKPKTRTPQRNLHKTKVGSDTSEVELADRWYIRLLAVFLSPLYAALKIYDLYRFIKKLVFTALRGLLDFIVFFFLFGWFWNTCLFQKFKRLICIRLAIKHKVHYYALNLLNGFLQGYLIILIVPVPDHLFKYFLLTCASLILISVIASVLNKTFFCFYILLLPTMASRHGRRFMFVLLVASLLQGPISNIKANSGLVNAQMSCIAQKARNVSDIITNNVQERYEKLHDHVVGIKNRTQERLKKIEANLLEVKDKVIKKYGFLLNIVQKVNNFADKCESTMLNLNKKCQDAFKSCKDKRSADNSTTELDELTFQDKTKREHIPKQQLQFVEASPDDLPIYTVNATTLQPQLDPEDFDDMVPHHVYYRNKTRYINHPAYETLHTGKIYHVRVRRGLLDIINCFFKNLFSFIIRPICDIIFNSIAFLCRIPKLLTTFISNIILKKYKYLEQTIKKNAWIEAESSLVFEKDVVAIRGIDAATKELREKLTNRFKMNIPSSWFNAVDYFKLLSLILVYYNTHKYLSTYVQNSSFDNVYIDKTLIKYDRRFPETIFPLKRKNAKKYIRLGQRGMSSEESYHAMRSSFKALGCIVMVSAIECCDRILAFLMDVMYEYGPLRVEHTINVNALEDVEVLSTNTSSIHLVFDTGSCFHRPSEMAWSSTGYNLALAGGLLVLSITQVYFMRTRHVICDRFDPIRRKRRAEFLRSKIVRSQEYNRKHFTETLFAKITQQNKLCRIFPWLHKPSCMICSRTDFLQRCSTCDTTYCVACFKNTLNESCKVCDDLMFQKKSSQLLAESSSKQDNSNK